LTKYNLDYILLGFFAVSLNQINLIKICWSASGYEIKLNGILYFERIFPDLALGREKIAFWLSSRRKSWISYWHWCTDNWLKFAIIISFFLLVLILLQI